jgi:hypothetical protein
MRLLPRSARWTWLAAVIIWLALNWLLWSLIPTRPKASWAIPDETTILAISADGEVVRTVERMNHDTPYRAVVRHTGFSAQARDQVAVLPGTENFEIARVSPDGNWLLLKKVAAGRKTFALADTVSGETKTLDFAPAQERPDGMMPDTGRSDAEFSPDGRVLTIPDPDRDGGFLAWRLPYTKMATRYAPADWPPAFSPDGRFLAWVRPPCREHAKSELVVVEVESGAERAVFRQSGSIEILRFTDDGQSLICKVSDTDELVCYWLDGRERWTTRRQIFLSRSGPFLAQAEWRDDGKHRVTVCGANDGVVLSEIPLPADTHWVDMLSPRTLAFTEYSPEPSTIKRYLSNWGLGRILPENHENLCLFNVATGQAQGTVPLEPGLEYFAVTPHGRAIAVVSKGLLQVWDIPPRKSLGWFAAFAAILALPIAWLSRRRVHRLRREVM